MKTFLLITIAFINILIFSSCKKGSGISPNSIIGTWELTSLDEVFTLSGNPPFSVDTTYLNGHSIITIFNANGTFTATDDTQIPAESGTGVYYLANDSLYDHPIGISTYQSEGKYIISNDSLSIISADIEPGISVITTELFIRQ
jgi:hypothetical protein